MKVAVIGAGPSGLTTIKQLRDEGHEVVCFDKNAGAGGIWYRDDVDQDAGDAGDHAAQSTAGETKAYDSLYLTISMKLMAFSDHPYQGGGSSTPGGSIWSTCANTPASSASSKPSGPAARSPTSSAPTRGGP